MGRIELFLSYNEITDKNVSMEHNQGNEYYIYVDNKYYTSIELDDKNYDFGTKTDPWTEADWIEVNSWRKYDYLPGQEEIEFRHIGEFLIGINWIKQSDKTETIRNLIKAKFNLNCDDAIDSYIIHMNSMLNSFI